MFYLINVDASRDDDYEEIAKVSKSFTDDNPVNHSKPEGIFFTLKT